MRAFRFVGIATVFALLLSAPAPALAQDAAAVQALRTEIDQLKRDFETRLADLESRLAALTGTPPPGVIAEPVTPTGTVSAPPAQAPGGGDTGALPVYANPAAASKVFNPDMAVIGNFLGAAGKNTVQPTPALELPESEASFQAVVDPYARADFFLSFGEQGVNVEEGYLTFPALPGGLLMRVGKMRAAFGKVNTLHTHVLPWTDRPLLTENLVGGEDGISDAGISVARLVPNPWVFLEATAQVFRGDSGDLFRSSRRADLSYVGHLRGYQDVNESTNVDVGLSYARGHNTAGYVGNDDIGRFVTNLYGADATVRWRPLRRSIYHSFIGRGEFVVSRQDQLGGAQNAKGFYLSGDYQLGRRWFTGLRFDRSDRANNADLHDSGRSLVLTYWPSEFSQVRAQVRRTNYAEGADATELLFQFQFAIGAHGAHPF